MGAELDIKKKEILDKLVNDSCYGTWRVENLVVDHVTMNGSRRICNVQLQ